MQRFELTPLNSKGNLITDMPQGLQGERIGYYIFSSGVSWNNNKIDYPFLVICTENVYFETVSLPEHSYITSHK